MRWEPKPYRLNGWEFQFENDDKITAQPTKELVDKISAKTEELCREIAKAENLLMLNGLDDAALTKLIKMCKDELSKRKEFRKSFKL